MDNETSANTSSSHQSLQFTPSRKEYRISAVLIDGTIVGIPSLLILFIFKLFLLSPIIQSIVLSILGICYYAYFHANKGATIGKNACGLRVVRYKKDELIPLYKAFLREIIKTGPLLILFLSQNLILLNFRLN